MISCAPGVQADIWVSGGLASCATGFLEAVVSDLLSGWVALAALLVLVRVIRVVVVRARDVTHV